MALWNVATEKEEERSRTAEDEFGMAQGVSKKRK